ncbi:hypothetical protein AWENTII_011821 [Aspergillus wentii]
MTKAPTFNNNAGNFNQVTGGYVQAVLLPDAGKSQVPGTTHTPLVGPASLLRMARKDGSYDVYAPTKTADFEEKESVTVTGQSAQKASLSDNSR